jgi:plasmid stabilization system protein ParE
MDAVRHLAVFPNSGRAVPEIGRDDIREIILDGYRIVYQIRDDRVVVLTFLEGHLSFSGRNIPTPPGTAPTE